MRKLRQPITKEVYVDIIKHFGRVVDSKINDLDYFAAKYSRPKSTIAQIITKLRREGFNLPKLTLSGVDFRELMEELKQDYKEHLKPPKLKRVV